MVSFRWPTLPIMTGLVIVFGLIYILGASISFGINWYIYSSISSIIYIIAFYSKKVNKCMIAYANFTLNTKLVCTVNMISKIHNWIKDMWVEGSCSTCTDYWDEFKILYECRTNPFYSFLLLSSMFNQNILVASWHQGKQINDWII